MYRPSHVASASVSCINYVYCSAVGCFATLNVCSKILGCVDISLLLLWWCQQHMAYQSLRLDGFFQLCEQSFLSWVHLSIHVEPHHSPCRATPSSMFRISKNSQLPSKYTYVMFACSGFTFHQAPVWIVGTSW